MKKIKGISPLKQNYIIIVIVLCELLDLVWLNQSFRHSDPQVVAANEQLIAQLYQV